MPAPQDLTGNSRRSFLRQTSVASASLFLSPLASAEQDKPKNANKPKGDEGISPAEDLMREHGVLNRILLIYDHHLHLLSAKNLSTARCWPAPPTSFATSSRSITRNWKRTFCSQGSARRTNT